MQSTTRSSTTGGGGGGGSRTSITTVTLSGSGVQSAMAGTFAPIAATRPPTSSAPSSSSSPIVVSCARSSRVSTDLSSTGRARDRSKATTSRGGFGRSSSALSLRTSVDANLASFSTSLSLTSVAWCLTPTAFLSLATSSALCFILLRSASLARISASSLAPALVARSSASLTVAAASRAFSSSASTVSRLVLGRIRATVDSSASTRSRSRTLSVCCDAMVRSCVAMRSLHLATFALATRASSTRARSFADGPPDVPDQRGPMRSKSRPAHGSGRARSLGLGLE